MNGKRYITLTVALTITSGVAAAGEVTIGQKLASGVQIDSHTGLSCSQVYCDATGRSVYFTSLGSGALSAVTPSFTAGLPNQAYTQLITLSGHDLQPTMAASSTSDTASTTTVTDPNSTNPDSFIMTNGQIIPMGGTTPTDFSAQAAARFSDPVVSTSFNANSTSIAVDVTAPPTTNLTVVDSVVSVDPSTLPAGSPTPEVSFTAGTGSASTPSTGDGGSLSILIDSSAPTQTANVSTPEPGTDLLIGIGLVAVGAFVRVKRRATNQ